MNITKSLTARLQGVLLIGLLVIGLGATGVSARPKATKPKKKPRVTTSREQPKSPPPAGASRNFSCIGSNEQRVTERIVSGTVSPKIAVTNVTVTQTHQLIDNALVQKSMVVLTSPNPRGEQDSGSDLIVFRLNERPTATAADVDQLLTLYQFNFKNVLPAGPEFVAGLYFSSYKGVAGPAANEYRWSSIPSLTSSGAYTMKCTYV